MAPLPHRGHLGGVQGACANYTDEYVERLVATLAPTVVALEQLKLLDRAYIYGFDENPPSCEPQVRKLFGATKAAYPGLATAAVLNWSPMPVDLPVDIWILQARVASRSISFPARPPPKYKLTLTANTRTYSTKSSTRPTQRRGSRRGRSSGNTIVRPAYSTCTTRRSVARTCTACVL